MNPLAAELNKIIESQNPHILKMMSVIGKNLFFPKGILTQSAEAKEKAYRINATAGIATRQGRTMHLPSVMESIEGIQPEDSLNYAPSFGIPALREAWQSSLRIKNPSLADKPISLPIITCGITHAVCVFADMWIDPGDVILIPDKMWGNYNMIFAVRKGAIISQYPIFTPDNRFNIEGFAEKVRLEAKAHSKIIVLLNFPHNPSGYTVSVSEANQIVNSLKQAAETGTHVIAVTDDSYFGLFYEEETLQESLFAHLAGTHARLLAVKLDGATKEDYVWGLRVGFCTYGAGGAGDPESIHTALEKKTAGCVRGTISNASHLSQSIVLRSMQDEHYARDKEKKFQVLKKRAKCVKQVLSDPKYQAAWDVYPFNSGYFMCLQLKTVDAETLRRHLLEKYGVGLISLGKRDLRVAFSCVDEEQIQGLFDTILAGVYDLSPR